MSSHGIADDLTARPANPRISGHAIAECTQRLFAPPSACRVGALPSSRTPSSLPVLPRAGLAARAVAVAEARGHHLPQCDPEQDGQPDQPPELASDCLERRIGHQYQSMSFHVGYANLPIAIARGSLAAGTRRIGRRSRAGALDDAAQADEHHAAQA